MKIGFFATMFAVFLCGHASAYELGIISMFCDCAPYLKEWVEYHRLVGVDHFWLYNDESKDDWEPVLKPYIQNGLVEVIPWKSCTAEEKIQKSANCWWAGHRRACRDGIERAKRAGIPWVAVIDLDEFLLPMKEKTVTECLKKHFPSAAAVYVNWRIFGTSHVFLKDGDSLLSSLTACTLPSYFENKVGKSIIRPCSVITDKIDTVHDFPLLPGATYFNGNGNVMQLAKESIDRALREYCENYIRINHYKYRDEHYFQKRARRDVLSNEKIDLLRKNTNLAKDDKIVQLVKMLDVRG